MGYAGACYVLQEVCNALFDALFNILPLGTDLDQVAATPVRDNLSWAADAEDTLASIIQTQPVLVRISAAKRLRDSAELQARKSGSDTVIKEHVLLAGQSYLTDHAA